MIALNDFIFEQLILESNEIIFPENGKPGKCKIYIGDHGKQRMQERNVSKREILDAIFGGYKEISDKFKEGVIRQSRSGEDSRFVIVDARKHKENPVCVVAFIARSFKNTKLEHPHIIIRTVYKGDDFSGATRNSETKRGKAEEKIFLY